MIGLELGEEYEGQWWLAEDPSSRLPGILKLKADGSARIQLLGDLAPWSKLELRWGDDLPVVPSLLGSVRGRRVSALSATMVGFREPDHQFGGDGVHGITSRTFDPRYLVVGDHIPNDRHRFKSVVLEIRHLDDWADHILDIWNDEFRTPFYRRRARVRGADYTFFGGRTESVATRTRTASSFHSVRIDVTTPATLPEMFYLWIRPLLSYVSVAVAAEAAILAQTLPVAAEDPRPSPALQLFTRAGVAEAATEELRPWEVLMPLRDGLTQKRIKRWLEIDRDAAHGLSNLSMLLSPANRSGANRLLNAATALESLHRALGPQVAKDTDARRRRLWISRQLQKKEDKDWFLTHTTHSIESSLAARLEAFAQPVEKVARWLVRDIPDWAERLRVARNDLAHALQRHMDPAVEVLYMHALTEVSAAVATARLMAELDYPEAEIFRRYRESPQLRGVCSLWYEAVAQSEQAEKRRSRP